MNKSDFKSNVKFIMGDHNEALTEHAPYLGKNLDDVLKSLGKSSIKNHDQIVADALEQLKEKSDFANVGSDTWYTGSASLSGAIRGSCDATVYFGDAGNYKFSGSMWTSPIVAAGGGAGAWSMIPRDGQEMDFTWWGASVSGGAVNILWNINGTIVGSMAIAVAGIGGGGGDGSGKWKQGN